MTTCWWLQRFPSCWIDFEVIVGWPDGSSSNSSVRWTFLCKIEWQLAGDTRGSSMSLVVSFLCEAIWHSSRVMKKVGWSSVFWNLFVFLPHLPCLIDILDLAANTVVFTFTFLLFLCVFARNSSFKTWMSDKVYFFEAVRRVLVAESKVRTLEEVRWSSGYWILGVLNQTVLSA